MGMSIQSLCESAEEITVKAGSLLLRHFNKPLKINYKSRFDMVTEADLESEEFIVNHLSGLSPNIPVVSEEESDSDKTDHEPGPSEFQWIVDPLDGTTNFAHGLGHFCISVALTQNQKPIAGFIYDPVKNEVFKAIHGEGAFLNNRQIKVSQNATLEKSIIATGFPYKVREFTSNNLAEFCAFRLVTQGVRRFGAAALDLAYVACGRLDGFWERWLKPWDTAAGVIILQEAGGLVTQYDGTEYSIYSDNILASNHLIHNEMKKILITPWPDIVSPILQLI